MSGCWQTLVRPTLGREQHRPRDREAMRAAARDLMGRGLRLRDVAESLRLTEQAVRMLLEAPQ